MTKTPISLTGAGQITQRKKGERFKTNVVTMEFEKRKKATLSTMNSPEPDKSPKGNIDAPIIPLLTTLNSHPCFFTTSSCSGRISVLSTPTASSTSTTHKKAKGGNWLFITHDHADPISLISLLFDSTQSPPSPPSTLVFRYEPLIIAVECRDIVSAQSLVSLAISCGFRESGITSVNKKRVIVAIRCSIRLEVPLGDTHKLMVTCEYVEFLVGIANDKMEANWRRTDNFHAALLRNGFSEPGVNAGNGESGLANHEAGVKDGLLVIKDQKTESLLNFSSNGVEGDADRKRRTEVAANFGSFGVLEFSLSINQMEIIGESVERLYIWGHSACTLENKNSSTLLIFGGFGGVGRHARRNDSLLLDPVCGKLESINLKSTPRPRLGHTASLVGDQMFLIGGRADPVNILNDVWVLNTTKSEWRPLQCTGSEFPPSHRHAAAVIGSNIYVYGGINNVISSSLYVLDTKNMAWSEISTQGEQPSARHSHSLVPHESRLFMFGGYDGEKALGDLYTFDVQRSLWKKESVSGRTPYARFSHSMFVYKNYIGIIGGCPIRQHCQELSILDLRSCSWKHVKLNSVGEDLFVRCTTSVVGDDLVIVGGGASCYAFGTKFNEPMRMNLLSLMSLPDVSNSVENGQNHVSQSKESITTRNDYLEIPLDCTEETSKVVTNKLNVEIERVSIKAEDQKNPLHWVLQLGKQHAKAGKDILKKFGWLDLGRKVYSQENGVHICFPVTDEFITVYHSKPSNLGDESEKGSVSCEIKETSLSTALYLLVSYGGTTHQDNVVKVRKPPKSPSQVMHDAVASLVNRQNLPSELLEQLPTRWDRLGDVVVLPVTSFIDPVWDSLGKELWLIVAEVLCTRRLARQGRISPTGTRDSKLEMLVGDNGWVEHRENGILYSFDATKCMFSWGNLSEKLRVARLNCKDEVIVDLFAGIGYFTLPFLVRANASLVYACEWNPHAVEALQRNLHANGVSDRCIVLAGDNRVTAPKGVADRVSLGLLPTSEGSWVTAVRALRSKGGILHVHGNVKNTEEDTWTKHVLKSLDEIARSEGYNWVVSLEHVERVKWYAPHIRHLVADVRCQLVER